ncbi:MAG TPA: anthranilate synthase component I, partial [Acidisphaera sp.]|nr:anthranilate synthase component I [Acidisphaera sp.]
MAPNDAEIAPGPAAFAAAYEAGEGVVAWVRTVADLETPVAAFMKLAAGKPNSFLLESIEGGAARGRYSVIGLAPDLIWRCRGGVAEVNRHALSAPFAFVAEDRPALESLRALIAESRLTLPPELPPMAAGLVGYLGYDLVRLMERLPDKNIDTLALPEALLLRPTLLAIFDNVRDELILAAPVWLQPDVPAQQAYARAQARLEEAREALNRPLPHAAPPVTLPAPGTPKSNFTPEGFQAAVLRAK